jgi:hypothetical protein
VINVTLNPIYNGECVIVGETEPFRSTRYLWENLTWHIATWEEDENHRTVYRGLYKTEKEAEAVLRRWEHQEKLGENKI